MNSNSIVIVIYSCKKNKLKQEILYNSLISKVSFPVYICYGDPTIKKHKLENDKYIVLKCNDDYNSLFKKTICLMKFAKKYFSEYLGVLKIDDDVYLNFQVFRNFLNELETQEINGKIIDYTGKIVLIRETKLSAHHKLTDTNDLNLDELNIDDLVTIPQNTIYCTGPIYYLSTKAISHINSNLVPHFYEDVMIGLSCANSLSNKIIPIETSLNYFDNPIHILNTNIHNYLAKFIFTKLHGGIGNMMFQIATSYGLAKKNMMLPYFISLNDKINTDICKNIPMVSIHLLKDYVQQNNKLYTYENEVRGENCLLYKNIITNNTYSYFLNGYFQNEKYFIDIKDWIIDLFYNKQLVETHLKNYPDLNNSYFIHIRLGDYLNIPLHYIILKEYYIKCIKLDPKAHYYILSDSIDICKTYSWLYNYNVTFIEDMEAYSTIMFMAAAGKGGICSNSTFSWWGGYLGSKQKRHIYFPRKWINNNWECDIWFSGSIVIE
jgi:hypothetical protein